jgi:hypothetical protein
MNMNNEYDPPFLEVEEEEEGEKSSKLSKKEQAIIWRRSKIADLYMKGHTFVQISDIMKVSLGLVHSDISLIRQQAKQQLRQVIESELPLQWAKTRDALQFIQQQSLEVWKNAHTDTAKLQALALFQQAQEKEFELVLNSQIIDSALRFVSDNTRKLEHLTNNDYCNNTSES